ncbi:MAG: type 1 glutamine amidotransferase, partial [Candidatus Dormibacteraceae bacterium]
PGDGPEIGCGKIRFLSDAAGDPLFDGLPDSVSVLHWHGDTVDLPAGVSPLASSEQYPNQAFRLGHLAWGMQFHLEITAAAVDRFCATFEQDVAAGGGAETIRTTTSTALTELEPVRRIVLSRFAALAASELDISDRLGSMG